MHTVILSPAEKLSAADGTSIIDLARTTAEWDHTAELHLRAVDVAIYLSAYHQGVAQHAATSGSPATAAFHARHATVAESLADFALYMLDRHLDQQIRAAADAAPNAS